MVRTIPFVLALLLAATSHSWANDPLRVSDPTLLGPLTEEVPILQVVGARVVLLHTDALVRDFPQLQSVPKDDLRKDFADDLGVLTQQQLQYTSIRNTGFAATRDQNDRWLSVFPYMGRGGILTATLASGHRILADLKGSGIVLGAEQLTQEIAAWKNLQTDAQRDAFRTRAHSDGLMSLGEAIAEDFRQRALQGLFDRLAPGEFQTVESYGVIQLPLRILKTQGRSIPAAIYVRQANVGRYLMASDPRMNRFYTDYYGYAQTTWSGAAVDFGGVILAHPAFASWFEDVQTHQPTVDPQRTWIWARAHEIADLLGGTDAQRKMGDQAIAELEKDLQSRLDQIGPLPRNSALQKAERPAFPDESILSNLSDNQKILQFATWSDAQISLNVNTKTYLSWPVLVREAYIHHRVAPREYDAEFLQWAQSDPDPRLRVLAARKLQWKPMMELFKKSNATPVYALSMLAAARGVKLAQRIDLPSIKRTYSFLYDEALQGDPSTVLLALEENTPLTWRPQDLWKLYVSTQDPLVRLAILSRKELLIELCARLHLQSSALKFIREVVQQADKNPKHPDWSLFDENDSGAPPALQWIVPILKVLPTSSWLQDRLLRPEAWVERVEQLLKRKRLPAQAALAEIMSFRPLAQALEHWIQSGRASKSLREDFIRMRGSLLLAAPAEPAQISELIPQVRASYSELLRLLEGQRLKPQAKEDPLIPWSKRRRLLHSFEANLSLLKQLGKWILKNDPQSRYFLSTLENRLRLISLELPSLEFQTGIGMRLLEETQDDCQKALQSQ